MGRNARAKLILSAFIAAPTVVHAQVSGTWINRNSGSWFTVANWNSNPQAPDAGGTASLLSNNIGGPTITIGNNRTATISRLNIDGPAMYTLDLGTLNLTSSATINTINVDESVSTFTTAHTINSLVTGSAGLVKEGPGALSLTFPGNTYTGGTRVNGGTLYYQNDSNFGGGSVVLNGGTLRGGDLSKSLFIDAGGGTLYGTAGFATFSTVSSNITGTGPLQLKSIWSNPYYGIALTTDSTYAGSLSVGTGLRLRAGINSANGIFLTDAIWLSSVGKLGDNTPITLHGGMVLHDTNFAWGTASETVGTVLLQNGLNHLGDDALKIITPSLSRSNRATLNIGPVGMQVTGTAPAVSGSGAVNTTSVGIIPWAASEFSTMDPVTVDSGGQIRPLNSSEFITSLPVGVSTSNLKLSTNTTISSPITVNSFTVNAVSVSGSGTVAVTSGGVYLTRNPSPAVWSINVPFDFGTAEGVIHAFDFQRQNDVFVNDFFSHVNGAIGGSGGLTLAGHVALAGLSTYTGQTTAQGFLRVDGDVIPSQPGPLGVDSSPVILDGGALHGFDPTDSHNDTTVGPEIVFMPGPGAKLTFARDLVVRSFGGLTPGLGVGQTSGATFDDQVELSGNVTLESNAGIFGQTGHGFLVSGNINGAGRIDSITNTILSGNNSFTGGVVIGTGSVTAGSNTAFGSGTVWITGNGTISATAPLALANHIVIQANSRIGGTQPINFSGDVNLFGFTRIVEIDNPMTTFSGTIGNGAFRKTGAGELDFAKVQVATLTLSNGIMRSIPNGNASGTSYVQRLSIASGANLDLTNNDLVIDYATSTPINTVKLMLADGRLFTSQGDSLIGLGYGENSVLGFATFNGLSVDSTTLLVKYTFKGDADLDGDVDSNDLSRLALNWQSTGPWTSGDFDYNGRVDTLDIFLMASNWGAGIGAGAQLGESFDQALAQTVLVPEPAGICLLGSLLLLKRSRRSRNANRQNILS